MVRVCWRHWWEVASLPLLFSPRVCQRGNHITISSEKASLRSFWCISFWSSVCLILLHIYPWSVYHNTYVYMEADTEATDIIVVAAICATFDTCLRHFRGEMSVGGVHTFMQRCVKVFFSFFFPEERYNLAALDKIINLILFHLMQCDQMWWTLRVSLFVIAQTGQMGAAVHRETVAPISLTDSTVPIHIWPNLCSALIPCKTAFKNMPQGHMPQFPFP